MNKTEAAIQYIIWQHHNRGLVLPNIHTDPYGGSEVDALYITDSGYPWFYEIKCSKADFKNDFKKKRHQLLLSRSNSIWIKPKHFFYVCHGFTITPEECPEYAGLIIQNKHGWLDFYNPAKKAPLLFQERITPKQREFIDKKIMYRYLNSRHKIGRKAYDFLYPPIH